MTQISHRTPQSRLRGSCTANFLQHARSHSHPVTFLFAYTDTIMQAYPTLFSVSDLHPENMRTLLFCCTGNPLAVGGKMWVRTHHSQTHYTIMMPMRLIRDDWCTMGKWSPCSHGIIQHADTHVGLVCTAVQKQKSKLKYKSYSPKLTYSKKAWTIKKHNK